MNKVFINTTNLLRMYKKGGTEEIKRCINKYDTYVTNGYGAQKLMDAILENKSDIYIKECLQDIKNTK